MDGPVFSNFALQNTTLMPRRRMDGAMQSGDEALLSSSPPESGPMPQSAPARSPQHELRNRTKAAKLRAKAAKARMKASRMKERAHHLNEKASTWEARANQLDGISAPTAQSAESG
jgi:hypothetical protein